MPQLRASNGNRRERGLGAAGLAELIFLQSETEGASEGGREGETERTRPMSYTFIVRIGYSCSIITEGF